MTSFTKLNHIITAVQLIWTKNKYAAIYNDSKSKYLQKSKDLQAVFDKQISLL